MIVLQLKSESPKPAYQQIVDQIQQLIKTKALSPGDRLPSSRKLADQLNVHRTTVYRAYEELWAMGFIESRPGSYSIVRDRKDLYTTEAKNIPCLIHWDDIATEASHQTFNSEYLKLKQIPEANDLDFVTLAADPKLMPIEDFRKSMSIVLKNQGEQLLSYSDPVGYLPLREWLSEQMRQHGMAVHAKNIIMTHGCQNGIELILKLLVSPHSTIVVEAPTYISALPLFRFYRANVIQVPMTPDGLDLQAVEKIFQKESPALLYTMPNFHNPTGITTSQIHRETLLGLCETYRVPLVEDGFVEEMKYFGKSILPIKSMDKNHIVMYLGTFSKVIFPGIRIGWIAAHEKCIEKLCALQIACNLSGNASNQAAMTHFCQSGQYDLHLRRIHREFRKRMNLTLQCVRKYFPNEGIQYTRPFGGYTLWINVNIPNLSEDQLIHTIKEQGVVVAPGSFFYYSKPDQCSFRISIAQRNELEIEKGMQKIGDILKQLSGS